MNTLKDQSVLYFIKRYSTEKLTVSYLKNECKYWDIKGYSKMKKQQIIDLLVSKLEEEYKRRITNRRKNIKSEIMRYSHTSYMDLSTETFKPSIFNKVKNKRSCEKLYKYLHYTEKYSQLDKDTTSIITGFF